jgi:DNA-binding CsgD family transcriptional regulator
LNGEREHHTGVETRWDPLSVIVDLVNQVADTPDEADARVEVVIEILRAALDARMGLMIRADLTHLDVRLIGRALTPPIAAGLRHELRVIRLSDPLLDPVVAGDLHPTTAARAYGELPWRNSSPRAGCIRIWGCDQVVSLPITGGAHFALFMFGRFGDDFTDADLHLLAAVQPVVGGLGRLLRDGGASGSAGPRPRRVTLTDREGEVLRLLARGYKAATIGRMAGCSERTVHRHLSNIYVKLGVRDRLSAVNRANELGLLTEDQVLLA